jgi:protein O-mannosyl-transferase
MTTIRPIYLFLAFIAFFLVVIAVHHRAFAAPMYYDSAVWLEGREHVFISQGLMGAIGLFPQRPVPMATFYVNYLLGGTSHYGFRLFNALVMAASGVMLALVIVLLLDSLPTLQRLSPTDKTVIGFLTGLIYVVHPVQAYVVVYVWQRMALLSAFFCLCSMAAYLSARMGKLHSSAAGYGVCAVMFLMAMLSKESAITLPVVLLIIELTLFSEPWLHRAKRFAMMFGITAIIVGALSSLERAHASPLHPVGIVATLDRYYRESGLTVMQVAMEQCRLLFSYLGLVIFPQPSKLHLITPVVPLSESGAATPAIAYVVAAGLLVATGCYLLLKRPLSGLGILFFVLGLVPDSLMVPQYLFVVYRVAFPMAGILMVIADVTAMFLEKSYVHGLQRPALITMVACVAVCSVILGAIGAAKADLWRDPVHFWGEAVRSLPPRDQKPEMHSTAQVLNSLGFCLRQAGRTDEALALHQEAIKVNPRGPTGHMGLGEVYRDLGNKVEAEASLRRAVELAPEDTLMHEALANFFTDTGQPEAAESHFRKAIKLDPNNPRILENFARLLVSQRRYTDALPSIESSLRLDPRSANAHYFMAKALMHTGAIEQSIAHLSKALEFKSTFWQAHNDIGVALARSGKPHQAIPHFRKALDLNPLDAAAKANLAAALQQVTGSPPSTNPGR